MVCSISFGLFPLVREACKHFLHKFHIFFNSLSCQSMNLRKKALIEVNIPWKEVTNAKEDQNTIIEGIRVKHR